MKNQPAKDTEIGGTLDERIKSYTGSSRINTAGLNIVWILVGLIAIYAGI